MAFYDPKRQPEINAQHLDHPEVGDYWHDHMCPALVVVGIVLNHVVVCEDKTHFDKQGNKTTRHQSEAWFWDFSKLKMYGALEFKQKLGWTEQRPMPWADVAPKHHLKYVEEHIANGIKVENVEVQEEGAKDG